MTSMVRSSLRSVERPASRRVRRWSAWSLMVTLAGCGATQMKVETVIPPPLVTRIPVVVGIHVPPEFSTAVQHEKRDGSEYMIDVGQAQTDGFVRLMNAMFTRVVPVASVEAGAATDPEIRGVFEPQLVELSFVTPRDTGTSVYAVSLKYRITAYTPSGQPVDSWTFTGYGTQPGSQMPGQGTEMLKKAAALAMRDAGAKIAVEFREQAIVRGLIDESAPMHQVEVQPPP